MKRRAFIGRLVASFGLLVSIYGTSATTVAVPPASRLVFLDTAFGYGYWTPITPDDETWGRLCFTPADLHKSMATAHSELGIMPVTCGSLNAVEDITAAERNHFQRGLLHARIADILARGGPTKPL